ncbi:DUF1820 family protein [Ectothiorhodospira mobilis]|uniref:DUF1820 family protein n=1 Tax=Ectothiorhodospira mobilis TaxID=195064 RepID=UPI001EE998C4|nr:DUF1820 family protein [Ectothiorhodospira mobilis]MCG5536366.1 DUF1820 family protein [Ectothiorhodospira mobilis]
MSQSKKRLYRITFINQGKVYEVFAQHAYQGEMYGFVIIEDLVFGEHSTVVVDPTEEKLKSEFSGVKRSLIPMHAVVRIDEVEKEGVARIHDLGSNVTTFPASYLPQGRGGPGKDG